MNEKDGIAVLKVRDTGAGLSAEALARVFQTGDMLGRTNPRERGGASISMSAVRPIVELHGGMITAHSDGPGQGCEFVVRLPLAGTPPVTAATEKSRADVANGENAPITMPRDAM